MYARKSLRGIAECLCQIGKYLAVLTGVLLVTPIGPAYAQNFQANQIRVFYGDGYKLGGNGADKTTRTTLEFQHFSSYDYGSLYFFIDTYRDYKWNGSAPRVSFYGEGYTHLSTKAMGVSFGDGGFLADIEPGIGLNIGRDFLVALYGVRASFKVPGFKILNFGVYAYDNQIDPFNRKLDTTYQATLTWDVPFTIGRQKFAASGLVDWIGDQGNGFKKQIFFQPEIRWDLGNALGEKAGSFDVGLRYIHFNNKFGVEGVDDNVVTAFLVKKF